MKFQLDMTPEAVQVLRKHLAELAVMLETHDEALLELTEMDPKVAAFQTARLILSNSTNVFVDWGV